jgi:aspartyl aminopeptidase
LFDTQPACLGGIKDEFVYSARLDNQATCFVSIESLIAHTNSEIFENDVDISMVCLFDHEEVGSQSSHGAGSPVISEAVRRISTALSNNPGTLDPDLYSASLRKSFLFSVDQAHALHPNFPSKHEKNHAPLMNKGVVMKTNQNQRYTTNSVTGFVVRELVRKAGVTPVQEFVVRNDCPCGSTIGPIIAANTGIRAVDAGMPQLSMHSCREVMGIVDCKFCTSTDSNICRSLNICFTHSLRFSLNSDQRK